MTLHGAFRRNASTDSCIEK